MVTNARLAVLACILAVAAAAGPARAQVSQLDDGLLIEEMANLGMSELLERLLETEKPSDPARALYATFQAHRASFNNDNLPAPRRIAALESSVSTLRQLITDHRDHWERPVWQVNLAETIVYVYLPMVREQAAAFYMYGVPTRQQQAAYESLVAEAFEALVDADLRFFTLQGELPRQPDHEEKRVNTGEWARWTMVYEIRLPFARAHAALYTSALPDDHAYFTTRNAANPQKVVGNPAGERSRLLGLVVSDAEGFTSHDDTANVARPAQLLRGLALARSGSAKDASEQFDTLISAGANDFNELLARIGWAFLRQSEGQPAEAVRRIEAVEAHPLTQGNANLLNRLLAIDAHHRLLLLQVENDPQVNAYQPYLDLLNDRDISDEIRSFLRERIYGRWAAQLEGVTDFSSTPDVVLMAVAERAMIAGREDLAQAQASVKEGQPDAAQAFLESSRPKFERSIELNQLILDRENVRADVVDRVLLNMGLCNYFLGPKVVANRLRAAEYWRRLADNYSESPLATQAITYAISFLQDDRTANPTNDEVDAAYRSTAQVLFEKFPDSAAADNQRLYYGYFILQREGEFEKAIDQYDKVPNSHVTYWEAQREKVICIKSIYDKVAESEAAKDRPDADHLRAAAKRVLDEAERVQIAAEQAMTEGAGQRAMQAAAWARLIQADIHIEQGNDAQAVNILRDFDTLFGEDEALLQQGLAKRIVALARTGKLREAAAEAQTMMERFPNQAADVIAGVLDQISDRIDVLTARANNPVLAESDRKALRDNAQALARTAVELADLLLRWAAGRGIPDSEMLGYRLLRVKALLVSDRAEEALQIIKPIFEQYGTDANVVHYYAETLFRLGDKDNQLAAVPHYLQLRKSFEDEKNALWWNAWMRQLQITDLHGSDEGKANIPIIVDQLRRDDLNLGGERYYNELSRLQRKYAS